MSRKQHAPWIICPHCAGNGTMDRLGEVNPEDFDDEGWQDYLDGAYDAPCAVCSGAGKVRADFEETDGPVIVRDGMVYRDADDASEHWLRMAGG